MGLVINPKPELASLLTFLEKAVASVVPPEADRLSVPKIKVGNAHPNSSSLAFGVMRA
jgi:hypothetical protein